MEAFWWIWLILSRFFKSKITLLNIIDLLQRLTLKSKFYNLKRASHNRWWQLLLAPYKRILETNVVTNGPNITNLLYRLINGRTASENDSYLTRLWSPLLRPVASFDNKAFLDYSHPDEYTSRLTINAWIVLNWKI